MKIYLGPETTQFKYISFTGNKLFTHSEISNYIIDKSLYTSENVINTHREEQKKAIRLVDSYIEFININGVHIEQHEKANFLAGLDNQTLWALISAFVVVVSLGSFWVGKYDERVFETKSPPTSIPILEPTDSTNNKSYTIEKNKRQDSLKKN